MNFTTVGLDLAKNVFQAHGASSSGAVVFEGNSDVCGFRRFCQSASMPGGDRSLRHLALLGARHRRTGARRAPDPLIPSAFVKPFVKRQSDMADAEAICEAG